MNLQFGRLKGGFWAGSASDDTAVYSQRVSEKAGKVMGDGILATGPMLTTSKAGWNHGE